MTTWDVFATVIVVCTMCLPILLAWFASMWAD